MQQIKKEAKVPANAESKMYVYLNQSIYSSPFMYITQTKQQEFWQMQREMYMYILTHIHIHTYVYIYIHVYTHTNRHLHSDAANGERSRSSALGAQPPPIANPQLWYVYTFTHMNESCLWYVYTFTYERVINIHIRKIDHRLQIHNFGMYIHLHVTQTKESCHTPSGNLGTAGFKSATLVCRVHLHGTHMKEACHTRESLRSHIWKSRVAHVNESWHTYRWVMWHMWRRRITHMIVSSHTWERIAWHI